MGHTKCNIEIEEHKVKSVNEAVYLGVKFSADGRMKRGLDRRNRVTMSAFGALKKNAFRSKKLRGKHKVEVYNAMEWPMMNNGC